MEQGVVQPERVVPKVDIRRGVHNRQPHPELRVVDDKCVVCGMTVRIRLIDEYGNVLEDAGYPCDCTCTCSLNEECFNCRQKNL
jgi:hypothetical protein